VVGILDLRHGHSAQGQFAVQEIVPVSTGVQHTVTGAIDVVGPREPTQPVESQP